MQTRYGPDGFPLSAAQSSGRIITLPLFVKGQPVTSGPAWEAYMVRKRVETMLADRAALLAKP
jgi:hypothetical protein